jgi:hypothetical protein
MVRRKVELMVMMWGVVSVKMLANKMVDLLEVGSVCDLVMEFLGMAVELGGMRTLVDM